MALVIDVMQGHKQALLQKEQSQMVSMARKWGDVERAVQDKVEVFVNRVAQDGLTPGQLASRQFQLDRYASLLRQVQKEHEKYVDYADGAIQAGQKQYAAAGIKAAGDAIKAVGADYGVKMAFDILPVDAVEFMVGLAGDGSPLRDLLVNAFASGAQGMLDNLIKSTAMGHNPQRTARQMVREGLSQSLSRVMNIARTEQLRVHRESSRQQYIESKVVESYRRLATKDSRVCAACLMADGETYDLTESLKEHNQGRCTGVPTVMGFKPVQWERGPDWLMRQDPAVQKKILGAGRFQGWQEGKFDLDQIIAEKSNPTWGNSLHPASLKDLLSGSNTPYRVRLLDPDHFTPLPTPPIPRDPIAPLVPQLPPPDQALVWADKPLYEGQELNGVPLTPATPDYWLDVKDVKFKNKKEPALPSGTVSTGVVIIEPDGRAWVVEPKNHFGGYQHTFAKGRKEPDLTGQQNALKELYEEMGLSAEITGMVGDFKGTTTTTRYYLAKRTGGAPWEHGWETENVKLAPLNELDGMLNMQRDKDVLAAAQKLLNAPAPKPRKPRTPKVVPEPTGTPPSVENTVVEIDTFPSDLRGLEVVKRLGGSTGAELVRDKATGRMYVKKKGNNPGHLLEETYADAAYRALGVNVPNFKVYSDNGAPVKLAEFMDGARSLADIKQSDPKLYKRVKKELQKDFAADALMGNWDVIGLSSDNVLVDKDGKPWRIDNGGSFRYRAQGALKTEFSPYVDELWTLRDKKINAQTAEVFGDIGYYDLAKQMKGIDKKRDALLAAIPEKLRGAVGARLDNLKHLARIGDVLGKDSFDEGYADNFARHSVNMYKAGLIDALPKTMSNSGVIATDENGKRWDHLRGAGSIIEKLADYMRKNGGDYENIIPDWAGQQAADSWTRGAQAGKYFYATKRPEPEKLFWWKQGIDKAKENYDQFKAKVVGFDETMTIWHAFNYEFMQNVDFKLNNKKKGVVKLMRTENSAVMRAYNMNKGDKKPMLRGAVESYSIWKRVTVFGTELTYQEIPHHRIFGNYMLERAPGYNGAMFATDSENEFVAMSEGVDVTYAKR